MADDAVQEAFERAQLASRQAKDALAELGGSVDAGHPDHPRVWAPDRMARLVELQDRALQATRELVAATQALKRRREH